ncbi:MAG: ArsR/SmtB family transcription factor [Marmoricola sp.]
MTTETVTAEPVGTIQEVLAALADPIRLDIVKRLAGAGQPVACAALYDGISKSTASHHFKVLREAGITRRVTLGGQTHQQLRLDDVEARYPGVLAAIVAIPEDAR